MLNHDLFFQWGLWRPQNLGPKVRWAKTLVTSRIFRFDKLA